MEMYFNRIGWVRRGIFSPFQIRNVKSYLSKTVNYILSVRIIAHYHEVCAASYPWKFIRIQSESSNVANSFRDGYKEFD